MCCKQALHVYVQMTSGLPAGYYGILGSAVEAPGTRTRSCATTIVYLYRLQTGWSARPMSLGHARHLRSPDVASAPVRALGALWPRLFSF